MFPRVVGIGAGTVANTLALLAATSFALGTTLQQKGALRTGSGLAPGFLLRLLHQPVWLAGMGFMTAGWFTQAAAFDRGSLIVVQSIVTLQIVIALPLGAWITDQVVGRSQVLGGATVCIGIVVFVAFAEPAKGHDVPPSSAWWTALVLSVVAIGALSSMGRRRTGAPAAVYFGLAAGVAFGFQAVVTRLFVDQLGAGVAAIFQHWAVYALVACSLVGVFFQQAALKMGSLASAMASATSMTLLATTAFGATVYGETLSRGGGTLAAAVAGLGLIGLGVVTLGTAQAGRRGSPEGSPALDDAA